MGKTTTEKKQWDDKRIRELLVKHKGIVFDKKKRTQFKEPVAFLIRESGRVEFYEDVKGGEYEFEHSSGEQTSILLNPAKQLHFDYGNITFRGYIIDENNANVLPDRPGLDARTFTVHEEKALSDMRRWKVEELKAKSDKYWTIAVVILGLVVLYILYKMIFKGQAPTPAEAQTITTTIT